MRKAHRLSEEELAAYQWQMPKTRRPRKGEPVLQDAVGISDTDEVNAKPLNWFELFGNPNPVEIEVGMGKGLFLLTSATDRLDVNFFGIEMARKYQLYATTRFALRRLMNVKTVCADARWVLRQFVSAGSVAAVHVYFPDPWWKARHKKRRVFTDAFADAVASALSIGGRLHIASDVEEYFWTMTGIVRDTGSFCELRSEVNTASLGEAGYQTNFERKARQKGTPIWRAEFERIACVHSLMATR